MIHFSSQESFFQLVKGETTAADETDARCAYSNDIGMSRPAWVIKLMVSVTLPKAEEADIELSDEAGSEV